MVELSKLLILFLEHCEPSPASDIVSRFLAFLAPEDFRKKADLKKEVYLELTDPFAVVNGGLAAGSLSLLFDASVSLFPAADWSLLTAEDLSLLTAEDLSLMTSVDLSLLMTADLSLLMTAVLSFLTTGDLSLLTAANLSLLTAADLSLKAAPLRIGGRRASFSFVSKIKYPGIK